MILLVICMGGRHHQIAPCKEIQIPESRKFLLVESGILSFGIQNPAFGIQDSAKKGIQNPFAENPFQIVLAAFTRIHATSCRVQFTHVVNWCSNLESVYITKGFKSHRICLEHHQYGRYLIVLEQDTSK